MTLVDVTPIAPAALPVAALRDHLRLGSGFTVADLQEDLLRSFLRAALAAIEARTGKAILAREFRLTLHRWGAITHHVIPIAPVTSLTDLQVLTADGVAEVVDPARYVLQVDTHHPMVLGRGGRSLPVLPAQGTAELRFHAGFGAWAEVPADLAQAVLMLAAHYYEHRDDMGLGSGCMPFGVTALIERHRPLRIGGAS